MRSLPDRVNVNLNTRQILLSERHIRHTYLKLAWRFFASIYAQCCSSVHIVSSNMTSFDRSKYVRFWHEFGELEPRT